MAAAFWLGILQSKRSIRQLGHAPPWYDVLVHQLGFMALFVMAFWAVSASFAWSAVALVVGATFLGHVVYVVIGAVSGFWLEEKRNKLAFLMFASSYERGFLNAARRQLQVSQIAISAIAISVLAMSVIGTLWVFWTEGPSAAKPVRLAWTLFIMPSILGAVMMMVAMWPAVATTHGDDDVRNSSLAFGLMLVFPIAAYLAVPRLVSEQAGASLPSAADTWVIVSAPFLIYLFAFVCPFFLGLSLSRHRTKQLLEWRKQWLRSLAGVARLPESQFREARMVQVLTDLEREITRTVLTTPLLQVIHFAVEGRWVSHDRELIRYRGVLAASTSGQVSGIVVDELKDLDSVGTPGRNVIAGLISGAVTAGVPWVLSTWQSEVTALVRRLVVEL